MSAAEATPLAAEAAPRAPFVLDLRSVSELREQFVRVARSRYHLRRDQAEDIAQTTFAAYLQVRHRYSHVEDHRAILAGIFRNKCLTYIDGSAREARRLKRYFSTPDAARENPWIRPGSPAQAPSVLEEIVRRETRSDIRGAIARLRPTSRQIAAMVVFDGMGRGEMIERLGLNKNTLDSRLHACRTELKRLLAGNELGAWRLRRIGPRSATSGRRCEAKTAPVGTGFGVRDEQ